jgi:hypothetical protein
MAKWKLDDGRVLELLTPDQFKALPEFAELVCIDGTTAVKGRDLIDDDTRGGRMAYGQVVAVEAPVVRSPLKTWSCKIGEVDPKLLQPGSDGPMRAAVEDAYYRLTGQIAKFTFSGWGAELTESERSIVTGKG